MIVELNSPFYAISVAVPDDHGQISPAVAREAVQRSIGQIKAAIAAWKALEESSSATPEQRAGAKQMIAYAHMEFAWQWINVEQVLKGLWR